MSRKKKYKPNTPTNSNDENVKETLEKNYKVVSNGGLRIRKYPSQDDETLTIVRNGTLLTIDDFNESETWGHVIFANGEIDGWVMMRFVKKL